jgi:hypothetical protein
MAIRIKGAFKITADGKIAPDHKAAEAKLDLCTRLKRRGSKKITVKRGKS